MLFTEKTLEKIQDGRTWSFLDRYLEPFRPYLDDPLVSEICVNDTEGFWVEKSGRATMQYVACKDITPDRMTSLARILANNTQQAVNRETPLLSTTLPTGERVQIVLPPATPVARGVAFSIRKQVICDITLQEYKAFGMFDRVKPMAHEPLKEHDKELQGLLHNNQIMGFLQLAVTKRKNILISGGTSTGKTTLLNALLKTVDVSERIITIEDTSELHPPQKNWLSLLASKGEQGVAKVTIQDLLEASLRLRPDRILLGELRGKEAYTFLRAINTGHPGSITTVHADTPQTAFQQVALMVQQADIKMTYEQILKYIQSIIDIVLQIKREGGQRYMSHIWYPEGRW